MIIALLPVDTDGAERVTAWLGHEKRSVDEK